MKENSKANKVTAVLYFIYLIALFWIILFKFNLPFSYVGNKRSLNFIPFMESVVRNGRLDFVEIIMNVMIFVPLGIYAAILFDKWVFAKKIFLFFSISFLFEAFQFIFGIGASDITDVINNTIGGILGLILYKGIEKLFKNKVKAQNFINIIATIGTVAMALLLFWLKLNGLVIKTSGE
jgi:glycopeptide antibiotics resistance protein